MKKILSTILLLIGSMIIILSSNSLVNAVDTNTSSLTNEALYNLTNTYNYNPEHEEYESHYFMTRKNS